MNEEADGPVVLNGVSADADSVGLMGYGSQYRVQAQEISSLSIEYGRTSRNPLILFALGVALVVVGCLALAYVVRWLRGGGVIWDVQVLVVLLLPLGGYLMYLAFHKGHVLRVVTRTGERVFPFSQAASPEELNEFIVRARDRLGCTIE